jgi:uncharacterized membrane protein (DUF4010 family)
MDDETKKMLGFILVIALISYGLSPHQIGDIMAENTRHIFWLLVVCFAAWSFRSYKTGK